MALQPLTEPDALRSKFGAAALPHFSDGSRLQRLGQEDEEKSVNR
jgi:hypothetical protein